MSNPTQSDGRKDPVPVGGPHEGPRPTTPPPGAPPDSAPRELHTEQPAATAGATPGVPDGTGPAQATPDPAPSVSAGPRPHLTGRVRPRARTLQKPAPPPASFTAEQKLLILDTWKKSGLPSSDFAELVGVTKHTLFAWKKKFEQHGPGGLMDQPRGGPRGTRLPDLTCRTILMMKEANPVWGCQRISDMLVRGPGLAASPQAVARVLHDAGYQVEDEPTHPHPDHPRTFERATPNQLWQTDLFTFILKRQNRRVYLVAFMDDHSRFVVSYGLHASASALLVIEVLRAGIASFGPPAELLSDNGPQYVTWRGKSAFAKELEKLGIQHVVSSPRHPQTLGKIERYWGTLWKECLEAAVFVDFEDARKRIGLFIDYYNFQRPHQGLDGMVPADRFFKAAEDVKKTLAARVAANALTLARTGVPKSPFYVTGQVAGKAFSVHAEGERVYMTPAGGERREIDLVPPPTGKPAELPLPVCPHGSVPSGGPEPEAEPAPGTSPLDALRDGAGPDAQKGGDA